MVPKILWFFVTKSQTYKAAMVPNTFFNEHQDHQQWQFVTIGVLTSHTLNNDLWGVLHRVVLMDAYIDNTFPFTLIPHFLKVTATKCRKCFAMWKISKIAYTWNLLIS